jgi:hypothetical protein
MASREISCLPRRSVSMATRTNGACWPGKFSFAQASRLSIEARSGRYGSAVGSAIHTDYTACQVGRIVGISSSLPWSGIGFGLDLQESKVEPGYCGKQDSERRHTAPCTGNSLRSAIIVVSACVSRVKCVQARRYRVLSTCLACATGAGQCLEWKGKPL